MSNAIEALKLFGQAWWERNDEVVEMDKFNRRVYLYMGTNSYLSASDSPKKVAEFAAEALVIGGAEFALGAVGTGAATLWGGPVAGIVGGFAGAKAGAAWGKREYDRRFKPLIQKFFPGQEERAKREYTGIMETGAKMIGKVLDDPYLSIEEKMDKLSVFSKGYEYSSGEFQHVDPLASQAIATLKIYSDEHIRKLKEVLAYQQQGFQPTPRVNAQNNQTPAALSPSKKGTPQAKTMLSNYGIDFDKLEPNSQFLVAEAAKFYTKMVKKIRKEDVFQFGNDLFDLFAFAKDPHLQLAGKVGKQAIHLIKDFTALPGAIIAAPNFLAAIHPVAVLAMGILSVGGILRRGTQPDPLESLKKPLQETLERVAAMHRDMLAGIHMLAEGQQRTYETMMERFDHLEELLMSQSYAILRPILINLERVEQRLIVLHQQFSLQMNVLHLSGFDELVYEVEETVHSLSSPEDEVKEIKSLKKNRLKKFEHWIEQKAVSSHLNGDFFVHLVNRSPIQNAEALVMNVLMHDGSNEQLSFFIAYLGNRAQQLTGDAFGNLNIAKLINPDIWTRGVQAYVELRQKFKACGIDYDPHGKKLKAFKTLGLQYLEFLSILKANQSQLFKKLTDLHQGHIASLYKKAFGLHAQSTFKALNLLERNGVKQQISYEKSEGYIRDKITDKTLINPILEQFDKYESYLQQEVEKMYQRWLGNMQKLLSKITEGCSQIEELYGCFDRLSCPFARPRQGTRAGESHLDIHTGPVFIRCEENGFKIPLSLSSLFEHDAALRNAIPKTFYLAEALGLGQFEINVVSQYVDGSHLFKDKEHAVLNQGSFYNHLYKFELSFASMGKRINLCLFHCRADQIPTSKEVLASAELGKKIKDYAAQIDSGKHGNELYWLMMGLGSKNCMFNQVKHLHTANHLTKTNEKEASLLERELRLKIQETLGHLSREYHQHFTASEKTPEFTHELENIDISRNMILAFMHLLGYHPEQIHQIQSLFNSSTLKIRADLHLEDDTLGGALAEVAGEATQTLLKITEDTELQEKLESYQETDIKVLINMIDALLLLDGQNLEESTISAFKPSIGALQSEKRHHYLEQPEKVKEGSYLPAEKTINRIAKAIMRYILRSVDLDKTAEGTALEKLKKILQKRFNQFECATHSQRQEDSLVQHIAKTILTDPLFPKQKSIHKFMIAAGIRNYSESFGRIPPFKL